MCKITTRTTTRETCQTVGKLNVHFLTWKCQVKQNKGKLKTNFSVNCKDNSQRQLCRESLVEPFYGKKEIQQDLNNPKVTLYKPWISAILKHVSKFYGIVQIPKTKRTDLHFKPKRLLFRLEVDTFLKCLAELEPNLRLNLIWLVLELTLENPSFKNKVHYFTHCLFSLLLLWLYVLPGAPCPSLLNSCSDHPSCMFAPQGGKIQ